MSVVWVHYAEKSGGWRPPTHSQLNSYEQNVFRLKPIRHSLHCVTRRFSETSKASSIHSSGSTRVSTSSIILTTQGFHNLHRYPIYGATLGNLAM